MKRSSRRAFLWSLALVSLARLGLAPAQAPRKMFRVGILNAALPADSIGPNPRSPSVAAFIRGMRELGYIYGDHFVTETRGTAGQTELFPVLADELVRLDVAVIVAPGFAMPALIKATSTIPIVMAAAGDPVGAGYVRSLGHPGGKITGFSLQTQETTGKRLEILKELVPKASPIAIVWDRHTSLRDWKAAEVAARQRGWKVISIEIGDVGEIENIFRVATAARAGALLACADPVLFPHMRQFIELADRNRLPTMYDVQPYVDAGGLVSYAPDIIEIWARAAVFVVKILKGARPGDLPVEQPTKFELVINLKAANSIGLAVPQSMLSRADRLIQ